MTLRSAALALLLASTSTVCFAAADQNGFTLVSRIGKPVGKASYTIEKAKDGSYKVMSRFQYRLAPSAVQVTSEDEPKAGGAPSGGGQIAEAEYTGEYKISEDGSLISGFTQNNVNQMMTSFAPDKTRKFVTIGQIQGGVNSGGRPVDAPKPDFLLAPDYDPSGIQVLLTTSLAHPHSDSTYLFLVPAGANPKGLNNFLYVTLQATGEMNGTLDGKPVTLKHYVMNYHSGKADLYTDASGTLMQADMGPLAVSYIRNKFALAAEAK